jgi:hypothetical protein
MSFVHWPVGFRGQVHGRVLQKGYEPALVVPSYAGAKGHPMDYNGPFVSKNQAGIVFSLVSTLLMADPCNVKT